ncbi:hypothetical protein JWR97_10290 [Pseudomonas cedrina subsp. fulgida]|nr:hypothetical protein [Pseudomonas cedrina subsp. fulgida]
MINVSSYTASSKTHLPNDSVSAVSLREVSLDEGKNDSSISTSHSASTTVSILAWQLNDAARRAEARVEERADPLDLITDEKYFVNKAQNDAQTPDTGNPELLARARQATDFLNGHDSNPFKGLALNQLNLIARDGSGSFTINERRAAWETMQSMEPPVASDPKLLPVNGRDIMIARLFGDHEPPVALPSPTYEDMRQNRNKFLTLDDRAVISDMYAYAQSEGADLFYVDHLVMSLSTYRYYSDGRYLGGGNTGYNEDRYRITFDFKPEDAAIAKSILNGSAINSTRIDQGFLQYILHPDHGAFGNIGGIPFLERMVKKFSSEGADQPPLGSEFATFHKIRIEDHIVSTIHKHIRLPPSKVVTQSVNGVLSLTEYGKAEGYVLDKSTRRAYKPAEPPTDQAQQRSTLDGPAGEARNNSLFQALADTGEQPKTRWLWPGHLFKLMKNFKP